MLFYKILSVILLICFVAHSVYNVYDNIVDAKTVEYVSSFNLTDSTFPFNFRITLFPGKCDKS